MKKIIAILLSVSMVLGMLSGCTNGHFKFREDTSLTRGQWIDKLATTFGLDEYNQTEPYLTDVSSSDEIFTSVQSCYEWGVLRDISHKLKKDKIATLEFVITTAVYAIGEEIESYYGKSDSEKALSYANAHNIASVGLNYNKRATGEQCQSILSAAQLVYLNQSVTPVDNAAMNNNVVDCRQTDSIQDLGNNEYVISGSAPQVGDVMIAPGTAQNPDGVAIKIAEVIDNGNGTYTVKTSTPELYEVFDEIEYSGVAIPEFEDIIPAEGVTVSPLENTDTVSWGNDVSPKAKELSITSTQDVHVAPLAEGGSKEDALSFKVNVNLTKGTLSVNPEWRNLSANMEETLREQDQYSKDLGTWFEKKSVFPDKTLFGPDVYSNEEAIREYQEGKISVDELKKALQKFQNEDGTEKIPTLTNKFKGGYEIVGELAITDLYLVPTFQVKTAKILGVDTGIPIGLEKFSLETNYNISSSLSIKGTIENELTLLTIPISLGGVATLTLEIKLYAELNGELSVKVSVNNNTKTEYTDGKTKKTTVQTSSAETQVELELETGPTLDAKISVCAIPLINAEISAALKINANGNIELSTEWTETDEEFVIDRQTAFVYGVTGYIPIIKLKIGSETNTLANKLSITFSWTLVGTEDSKALATALKFDILPEQEKIIWEEHLEIPKNNPTDLTETSESSDSNDIGSNIGISSYYIHLKLGEHKQLDIEYPAGYSVDDFEWSSSDDNVVSIRKGELTAKDLGSAIVTATSKDGKYYANCAVYVGE